ncbi:hypothetical protein BGW38_008604, partial [Lunasporangiospora selenospora]
MFKYSFVVLAAAIGLTSALDVFNDANYQGQSCRFGTPSGQCINIPSACAGQVSSVSYYNDWVCTLYDSSLCRGSNVEVTGSNAAYLGSFNDKARSVICYQ